MSYLGPVSSNQDGTIINYIPYGTIENNTTRGWSACTLTWSGTTPSGAPTLTATQMAISASSVSPLSSLYSLLLTKSAANAQYQGFVSDAFTIKREDLAKVLTGSFYYEVASGTVDMSGSSTQSLEIWVYNVNANQWIQPAGYRGLNQSSGPGLVSFTFQTDSTPANNSYRIAVITQQTSATAYTVKFDNFKLSPQTAPIGPVVTDWVSYTPTGSWTVNTTYSGKWRRVGDSIEVDVNVSLSGAPNATTLSINLPSGYSIDTSKISTNVSTLFGIGQGISGGTGYNFQAGNITTTSFTPIYQSNTNGAQSVVTQAAPVAWGSGNTIHMRASFPLSGASSNVQLSNDTDTRVVAFRATRTSSQSFPNAPASPYTVVQFDSIKNDTHGAWDSVNYRYTVPVSGFYDISARFLLQFATTTAEIVSYLVIDGVPVALQQDFKAGTANGNQGIFARFLWNLNAGQTVQVRIYQVNSGGGAISGVFELGGVEHGAMYVNRLSGPSVVAASETVACEYVSSAGNTITNNVNPVFIDFGTRQGDTHNAVLGAGSGNSSVAANTWRFVAPVSGRYQVNAVVSITLPAGTNIDSLCYIAVNGAVVQTGPRALYGAWGTAFNNQIVSGEVRINAGDYISIGIYQSSGANRVMESATPSNRVSIFRVGN